MCRCVCGECDSSAEGVDWQARAYRRKPLIGGHPHELKKQSITAGESRPSSPLLPAATPFRCHIHVCVWGGLKCTPPVPSANHNGDCTVDLMKCLCYGDSSQGLLGRPDHYAWLVITETVRQEAQRWYRLLCLHPSVCLCHTHTPARAVAGKNRDSLLAQCVFAQR